ncbi:MAG: dTMP kinase [Candidatus Omnitrophota bacterium]|nr:MAG: dTMP kinase [Candidatus Omnitrophota bacterium]
MNKRAFLISFEGIEGTGKSTQCKYLEQYLKDKRVKTAVFREPGTSVVGEAIRNILLHSKTQLTHFCEAMLFIAARAQLVEEQIKSNLYKKDIIILDRYIDATMAYQGYGDGVELELIEQLNKRAVNNLMPDLTILLDISPEIGLKRCIGNDRFEERELIFHQKVRQGYLKLAKNNSKRIQIVSAAQDIQAVRSALINIVNNAFNYSTR